MLPIIAGIIVVLIAVVLIFIITRPDRFRIERSAQIEAPASVIFALLDDFHEWHRWSPWEKLDPNMKKTFDGSARGPGAIYSWSGNSKAGEGRMTLLQATPDRQVSIKLEFMKPFKATNQATFKLLPGAAGTNINWAMEGTNNLIQKAFSPFMEKMVGKDFEQGLANLNRAALQAMERES